MFLVINYIHVCNNHKKCYLFLFCFKLSLSLFCIGCGESLGQGGAIVALRSRGGWLIDVVGHGVVVADLAWVTDQRLGVT